MAQKIITTLDTGITTVIVKEGKKEVVYLLENKDIVKSKEGLMETVKFLAAIFIMGGAGLLITYLFDA